MKSYDGKTEINIKYKVQKIYNSVKLIIYICIKYI